MSDFLRPATARTGVLLLALVFAAVTLGPMLAPFDPQAFSTGPRLHGPDLVHLMGTDQFGRDTFSRVLAGARATVLFGLGATAAAVLAGSLLGIAAGACGGFVDAFIMRLADGLVAVPDLLFALLIVTVLGGTTLNAGLAIAIAFTPGVARIARASVLSVRTREFVLAAVARGEGPLWIIFREVLPNAFGPVFIEATIRVSIAVMMGATLSFLGLGAQPPSSDWGLMISEARQYMFRNPWMIVGPGASIAIVALGFNLTGDALRDWFNGRRRS